MSMEFKCAKYVAYRESIISMIDVGEIRESNLRMENTCYPSLVPPSHARVVRSRLSHHQPLSLTGNGSGTVRRLIVLSVTIRIQEIVEARSDDAGRIPRTVDVELTRDLVDVCLPGDIVTICVCTVVMVM